MLIMSKKSVFIAVSPVLTGLGALGASVANPNRKKIIFRRTKPFLNRI
jgi:hypothetical protein